MTTAEMLAALKIDLGITSEAYDTRLTEYLETAEEMIQAEGAELDLTKLDHIQTVVMYAGWLWRKRDTGEGMPRMVRYQLNNLILRNTTENE